MVEWIFGGKPSNQHSSSDILLSIYFLAYAQRGRLVSGTWNSVQSSLPPGTSAYLEPFPIFYCGLPVWPRHKNVVSMLLPEQLSFLISSALAATAAIPATIRASLGFSLTLLWLLLLRHHRSHTCCPCQQWRSKILSA